MSETAGTATGDPTAMEAAAASSEETVAATAATSGDTAAQEAAETALFALVGDPAARANPYPAYEIVRGAGPTYKSSFDFWFITAYAECDRLMRHPDLVRQHEDSWERRGEMSNSTGRRWFEQQRRFLLFIDPPDHSRIRGLVRSAFTPRYLQHLRPQITQRVEQLIASLAEDGGGDLIAQLALPLPMMVICDMLGVPADDRESFRKWTVALAGTLEPFPSPEVQDAADIAAVEFESYFTDLVRSRRNNPADDLLSRLIEVEEAGEQLSEEELVATGILLLAAGFETTTNLIGNGTLALLSNRDQWDKLVSDPTLAPKAVEEILRYDSPVQIATPRVARTDIEVANGVVAEGHVVAPIVGAGNRDPDRFDDPARLDIERPDVVPLSFGGGPHFCLGASLARMEGAEVFSRLPQEIPTLALNENDPAWRPTMNIRGLERLNVSC